MPAAVGFSGTLVKGEVVYHDFVYRNRHLSLGKYISKFTFRCVVISFTWFTHVNQSI